MKFISLYSWISPEDGFKFCSRCGDNLLAKDKEGYCERCHIREVNPEGIARDIINQTKIIHLARDEERTEIARHRMRLGSLKPFLSNKYSNDDISFLIAVAKYYKFDENTKMYAVLRGKKLIVYEDTNKEIG